MRKLNTSDWVIALNIFLVAVLMAMLASSLSGCGPTKPRAQQVREQAVNGILRGETQGWSNMGFYNIKGIKLDETHVFTKIDTRVKVSELKVGDMINFVGRFEQAGHIVCHPVVKIVSGGVITKGFANQEVDPGYTTENNYIGKVVAVSIDGVVWKEIK